MDGTRIKKEVINAPLVSIITPVYNCEQYVEETIRSVLHQTYQNWEMILVDDISADRTLDIIRSYEAMDSRIKVLQLKEKGGASIARNIAIKKAQGKYIAFLDGDDLWLPDKLQRQIRFMMENNYVFTYTNYYVTRGDFIYGLEDEKNLKLKKSPKKIAYKDLLKKNCIGCLTVVIDAEKVGKINIPKLDKRNDYALWLKILRKGCMGFGFEEPMAIYRSHQGLSKGNKLRLVKYHYQMFEEVLEYGKVMAFILTVRNLYFYILGRK